MEPFVEEYMTDDADYVLVGQGTIAMPARVIGAAACASKATRSASCA